MDGVRRPQVAAEQQAGTRLTGSVDHDRGNLSHVRAAMIWMPIETAPYDGDLELANARFPRGGRAGLSGGGDARYWLRFCFENRSAPRWTQCDEHRRSAAYAALQSRSMVAGAIALAFYGVVVCHLLARARMRALPATILSLFAWLVAAFGLLALAGGQS